MTKENRSSSADEKTRKRVASKDEKASHGGGRKSD
jgi:hypothetical protein